jgi:hypothetical protein
VVDATSGGSWTDTVLRKGVKLGPGEKTKYARVFVVGERPDTSSVVGELALAAGQPVGGLEVHVVGGPPATGERVLLHPDGSQESLSLASPFAAQVPVGRYWASLASNAAVRVGPVEVKAGAVAGLELPVDPRAALDVGCRSRGHANEGEPLPCKLTFEGTGGTITPNFGPASAAGPARNQVTTAGAPVHVSIAPGTYRVTASRGPEYALDVVDVTLQAAETRALVLSPARVVDTAGYLACDFHQHTILGADAGVATRDRVIANAAEGVEVAVASEHNLIVDFEPIVRELGLARDLVAVAGDELTSDASRHPWGHANVWPMNADASKPRGGAPVVRDRTPHELFEGLRAARPAGDFVLQVNHPRSGSTGYFDLLSFDPARGAATDPGYDAAFDALEVWNGRNVEARARVLDDWRALLRTGHVVTATADTDTHGIVGHEAGYPRTYVRVNDDGHLDTWDASRTADLVRGVKSLRDVVLTNGPMLRVTAGSASVGGIAGGHAVNVKVHVECAPWVDVDTIRVVRASEPAREDSRAVKLLARKGRGGEGRGSAVAARMADVSFALRFDEDDAFFVVASGKEPLSPVLGGDAKEILPWAMTGAIWVDADGDGKSLGR